MRKLFVVAFLTLAMSFYVFPISFTFLPPSVNSKMFLAAFGLLAFVFDSARKGSVDVSETTLLAGFISVIFSGWCLFSIILNNTRDTTYVTYFVSFFTWMLGAYGVLALMRLFYDEVGLPEVTRYLALVGVFQCISAVLIDNNAAFGSFVDSFMNQGQEFYKLRHRLYGIGAALDPAGIRFSVILVMIANQFSAESRKKRTDNRYQAAYLVSFAIITVIGAVISRTTVVGAGMGIAYIGISLVRLRKGGFITLNLLRVYVVFVLVMTLILAAIVYFYSTSDTFYNYLRFGFEGFFSYFETGEFRTNSTDELSDMWVWPADRTTWLLGRGTFGVFDNFTDIGYCNFILYCGLIGMAIFSFYFILCHWMLNRKFRDFYITSLLLIALTFIVWLKVTTDIFFIDALLLCAAADSIEAEEEKEAIPELSES